jgi:sugar transferase (PEP-CTERM/EpsH1 system associated)
VSGEKPPLVLHVLHHLVIGGMENGLVNLVNKMPQSAYRHAICCIEGFSDFRQRIQRPDVEVIPLHRSKIGVWHMRRELFALCRQLRPAIVHSRNTSGLDAILPSLLAGVPNRVHGEHGWDVGDLRGTSRRSILLRRLHSPFVSRYVTVSRDLSIYLQRNVGIRKKRIVHICNGVDTDRFHPGDRLRTSLPPDFQDPSLFLIGTVGRLQPVKDQQTLLRAFATACNARVEGHERLRLVVVGDGPLMNDLRNLARSLGIERRTWFAGAIGNVSQVLGALDLFVLTSLNEGISNTILEALASGVPVIASDVGGNPELIDAGRTGSLVPAGSAGGFAAEITRFLAEPDLQRNHGEAARLAAVERFSLTAMVARYRALYDELCQG